MMGRLQCFQLLCDSYASLRNVWFSLGFDFSRWAPAPSREAFTALILMFKHTHMEMGRSLPNGWTQKSRFMDGNRKEGLSVSLRASPG